MMNKAVSKSSTVFSQYTRTKAIDINKSLYRKLIELNEIKFTPVKRIKMCILQTRGESRFYVIVDKSDSTIVEMENYCIHTHRYSKITWIIYRPDIYLFYRPTAKLDILQTRNIYWAIII